MPTTLTTVTISAMIGVVVGYVVREGMGGKRSSVGVHRRNGRILPLELGIPFFALVTIVAGFITTGIAAGLTDALPGLPALLLSLGAVTLFLSFSSYSR